MEAQFIAGSWPAIHAIPLLRSVARHTLRLSLLGAGLTPTQKAIFPSSDKLHRFRGSSTGRGPGFGKFASSVCLLDPVIVASCECTAARSLRPPLKLAQCIASLYRSMGAVVESVNDG
ncbi:uncharacterized protein SCHCODRAFT_02622416 [Schizophyllum commune H4-8]|uniref:uncharacterized protein n=1 Tax=Schizophyllum commune (strain H4-8 / FGSC 9210) TaxID=578458 RepID=UPI00215E1B27|nr:uncharacterized protein SCHCODRAFT_02622416 [Schizophyllum commune H4-8]KAI5893657.1 hypothetical protein SCHCODRAFT_02622416 [Schizophyllum commune H4-8]